LPVADFHRIIISTALEAARAAGFRDVALGGGNALIVRAGSSRRTQDVDLFCRKAADLPAIATVIVEAIEASGYRVERREDEQAWWEDEEAGIVELIVSAPGGSLEAEVQAEVQIAYFYYAEDEVVPGLGPVLSLDDLGGWKTTTIASRMAERDFVDYALLRKWYTKERLFELAAERDPGLEPADYADAAVHLDQRVKDSDLDPYLAPGQDAAAVRAAFADWSRDTRRDQ
jgi:hypothetical protein